MSKPRGHHYVPKFYLRLFADVRERLVAAHRSDLAKQYPTSVDDAARKRDFYAVELKSGWTDGLEKEISAMEGRCAPAVKRLAEGSLPSDETDRAAIAAYVAFQHLRGPNVRTDAKKQLVYIAELMLSHMSRAKAAALFRHNEGREPDDTEIDSFLTMFSDVDALEIKPHHNMVLHDALCALGPLASSAFRRTFEVVRWDAPVLLTSDAPVALWSHNDATPYGIGFGTADVIAMPLSRRAALVLHSQKSADRVELNPDRELADWLNWLVAQNATDRIFVHPESTGLLTKLQLPPPGDRLVVAGSLLRVRT